MKRIHTALIYFGLAMVGIGIQAASLGADFDGDGMPDQQEVAEHRDMLMRDHDIFSNNRWFVQQAWRDLFLASADNATLITWTAQMDNGMTRNALLRTLVQSPQFINGVAPAGRLRWAAGEGMDPLPTWTQLRADVVEYQRTASWNGLAQRLAGSAAFAARFPQASSLEFIRAIYAQAGLSLSAMEENRLAGDLDSGTRTRSDIVLGIANDGAFIKRSQAQIWSVVLTTLLWQRGLAEGYATGSLAYLDGLAMQDGWNFMAASIEMTAATHPEHYNANVENFINTVVRQGDYLSRFLIAQHDTDHDQLPDSLEIPPYQDRMVKDHNVFTNPTFFSWQQSRDFLFREYNTHLMRQWDAYLPGGPYSDEVLIARLLHSPILQDTAGALWLMYRAAFDATPRFSDFYYGGARMRSRSTLQGLARELVARPEFKSRYPQASHEAFVQALFMNVLKRAPTSAELSRWIGALDGGASRGELLLDLARSQEYQTPERLARRSWDLLHLAMLRSNVPALDAEERQQLASLSAAYAANSMDRIVEIEAQRARHHLDSPAYRARFLP